MSCEQARHGVVGLLVEDFRRPGSARKGFIRREKSIDSTFRRD
jgi:hypothetical protein